MKKYVAWGMWTVNACYLCLPLPDRFSLFTSNLSELEARKPAEESELDSVDLFRDSYQLFESMQSKKSKHNTLRSSLPLPPERVWKPRIDPRAANFSAFMLSSTLSTVCSTTFCAWHSTRVILESQDVLPSKAMTGGFHQLTNGSTMSRTEPVLVLPFTWLETAKLCGRTLLRVWMKDWENHSREILPIQSLLS